MKRKLILLACVAALVCSMFTACSLTQAQSITFAEQPQSVFVVSDTVDINSLIKVEVTMTDGSIRTDVPVRITGFSTSKVGVFTATVSYRGVSVSFTYYVVASLGGEFIGGSGTQEDPYLIANAEQFKNIAKYPSDHYELVADIDFGGEELEYGAGGITWFKGSLDGNGYTIKGLRTSSPEAYLFQYIYEATLQNFVFQIDSPLVIACDTAGDCIMRGIIMEGSKTTTESNHGNFVARPGAANSKEAGTLLIEDCTNNATMKTTGNYCAPFVGAYSYYGATVTFRNCVNNANVEAQAPGSFVGNSSGYTEDTYTFENCVNNGIIVGTIRAGVIGAYAEVSKEQEYQNATKGKGAYVVVDTVENLISFEDGALILDFDNENLPTEVVSFKVRMQFRTANSEGTSRYNIIKTISKGTGLFDTGFKDWGVVSSYDGINHVNNNVETVNYYSYPNLTATEGGNYQYVIIEDEQGGEYYAYYYEGDSYIYKDGGWIVFSVFAYDANGNLICTAEDVYNTVQDSIPQQVKKNSEQTQG